MPQTSTSSRPNALDPNDYEGEAQDLARQLNEHVFTPFSSKIGASELFMLRSYDMGQTCYEAGDYAKAEVFFRLLTLLDHLQPTYLKALAATLQMQGKSQEALEAYALASASFPTDAELHFNMAECALNADNEEHAHVTLEYLLNLTRDDPEQEALFQRAQMLVKALNHKSDGEK